MSLQTFLSFKMGKYSCSPNEFNLGSFIILLPFSHGLLCYNMSNETSNFGSCLNILPLDLIVNSIDNHVAPFWYHDWKGYFSRFLNLLQVHPFLDFSPSLQVCIQLPFIGKPWFSYMATYIQTLG